MRKSLTKSELLEQRMRQLSTLAVAVGICAVVPCQAAADKPDVPLIAVDDLNDWVGPLGGHPKTKTPNIDCLAERGMTFTNAHITAPLCNPSRASLMSGLLTSGGGKLFHAATVIPQQFYGLLPRKGFDDYYPAPGPTRRAQGQSDCPHLPS